MKNMEIATTIIINDENEKSKKTKYEIIEISSDEEVNYEEEKTSEIIKISSDNERKRSEKRKHEITEKSNKKMKINADGTSTTKTKIKTLHHGQQMKKQQTAHGN